MDCLAAFLCKREQPVLPKNVIEDASHICQKPADGDGPPDSCHAESGNGGKEISQRYTGAQGDDGEDHRHARPAQRAVQTI